MKLTRLEIHYGGNIDEREKNGRIMRESSYITEYVLQKLSKENFFDLTRMNIFKLNSMISSCWGAPTYQEYLDLAECKTILDNQIVKVGIERKVSVLNTALFVLVDYYGNQRGFYDSIMTVEKDAQNAEELRVALQGV